MNKVKLTKFELNKIFSNARRLYLDEGQQKYSLDSQAFMTLCYLKAASTVLKLDIDVDSTIEYNSIEE